MFIVINVIVNIFVLCVVVLNEVSYWNIFYDVFGVKCLI